MCVVKSADSACKEVFFPKRREKKNFFPKRRERTFSRNVAKKRTFSRNVAKELFPSAEIVELISSIDNLTFESRKMVLSKQTLFP
jgi:hypothetical protein